MSKYFPFFPQQASVQAGQVDAIFFFMVAVTAFFSLLIAGLIIFFAIKFRRRHDEEIGVAIHGSLVLELMWTIIPFFIAMGMFGWGAKVFFDLYRVPAGAMEVFVVGKQWMWKVQHAGGQREINELHVPLGRPVKLIMGSEDVIHSFYIPAFRVKADVIPGRYNTLWFQATKPGRYHLFCAEYCGTKHSGMIGSVVVLEQADYQVWLSGGPVSDSPVAAGEKLFQSLACNTCHMPGGRGPSPGEPVRSPGRAPGRQQGAG
jgi:cytochrome c oxidase subunit 2